MKIASLRPRRFFTNLLSLDEVIARFISMLFARPTDLLFFRSKKLPTLILMVLGVGLASIIAYNVLVFCLIASEANHFSISQFIPYLLATKGGLTDVPDGASFYQ